MSVAIVYDPLDPDSTLAAKLYLQCWRSAVFLVATPLRPTLRIMGDHAILLGVYLPAEQLDNVERIDLWHRKRDETLAYLDSLPAALLARIEVHGNERRTLTFATRAHLGLYEAPALWILTFEESMGAEHQDKALAYRPASIKKRQLRV
jgi:hypothetical protein